MTRLKTKVAFVAGLALMGCSFGCASSGGPASTADKTEAGKNYSYLDDSALEAFDADLRSLSAAIRRADTSGEQAMRIKLGESSRRYQSALISAINDHTSTPRRRIAGVLLGFTGDASVAGPLVAKLAQDEPESVHLNALLGLATLGDKLRDFPKHAELISALGAVLEKRDSSASIRRAAVMAYAHAFDGALNDSIQPLRDRFLSDRDLGVQIEAINALGQIGDPVAASDLVKVGLSHPNSDIRVASAIALGRIADGALVVPALAAAAGDDNASVRREAVNSLAAHAGSDPETVYLTVQMALGDFSDLVRESAALALARIKDARAVDMLLQATGDRTAVVRRAAATALGDLIIPERAKDAFPLIDLIEDEDPGVKRAAGASLVRITARDFGSDASAWRKHYYRTWPELDPANAYIGKPRPRINSNITGSGVRPSSTTPSRPTTTPSRPTTPTRPTTPSRPTTNPPRR